MMLLKNLYHKTKFIIFIIEGFNDTKMKIGYARISTKGENLNLQIEALERAGFEIIFRETGLAAFRNQ